MVNVWKVQATASSSEVADSFQIITLHGSGPYFKAQPILLFFLTMQLLQNLWELGYVSTDFAPQLG